EIVLPVEHRDEVDLRLEPEPGADRLLDAEAVDHRQHAGEGGVDGRYLRVRLGAEIGGGARAELRLRDHLGVHLEPDDDLPGPGLSLDQHRSPPAVKAGSAANAAAFSIASPTLRIVS